MTKLRCPYCDITSSYVEDNALLSKRFMGKHLAKMHRHDVVRDLKLAKMAREIKADKVEIPPHIGYRYDKEISSLSS